MNKKKSKNVVIAMSGGVDSSVAAYLLKQAGYNVMGVFLRLHDNYDEAERVARAVCKKLSIKFYPISAKESFEREVVDYFIKSYASGITPNPCVVCNKAIKFGVLLKMMKELKGDYLASGHYVKKIKNEKLYNALGVRIKNIYELHRGLDQDKDQSYFLYTLGQEQLRYLLFPLGKYTKADIKKIAEQEDLPALKTESQDVCFLVNEGKIIEHNNFLKERLEMIFGDIKALTPGPSPSQERGESDNKVIGKHKGLPLYTIGQRRGVEIGGTGPYYVARTDYKTNTLYVVNDANDPALFSDEFVVKNVNWISNKEPKMPYNTSVVIRYRHEAIRGTLSPRPPLRDRRGGEYIVKLKNPARAITPGQSAVFYDKDKIIGGGIIQ